MVKKGSNTLDFIIYWQNTAACFDWFIHYILLCKKYQAKSETNISHATDLEKKIMIMLCVGFIVLFS